MIGRDEPLCFLRTASTASLPTPRTMSTVSLLMVRKRVNVVFCVMEERKEEEERNGGGREEEKKEVREPGIIVCSNT